MANSIMQIPPKMLDQLAEEIKMKPHLWVTVGKPNSNGIHTIFEKAVGNTVVTVMYPWSNPMGHQQKSNARADEIRKTLNMREKAQ